jgi:dolichol-phosphate mannosyltransferase
MKDIVIIPTYNERDTIVGMIELVSGSYPGLEIWIVDDNSPDGTADLVRAVAGRNTRIKLIVRPQKSGLGDAYKDVLQRIQKLDDVGKIVTMDADNSHDPLYLREMLGALDEYDFVVGSRYVKGGKIVGWGWLRNLISRGGNTYVRMLTRLPIHDLTAGFVAFRAEALKKINFADISSSGYSYQMEFKNQLLRRGCSYKEIPITFVDRRVGQSKMSGKIVLEGILAPWKIISSS